MVKAQNQVRMTKISIQNWPFKSVGQTSKGSSNCLLIFDLCRTCRRLLIIKHSTTIIYRSIYAGLSVMATPETRWSVVSNMQIRYLLSTWASSIGYTGFLRLIILSEDRERESHVLSSEPALLLLLLQLSLGLETQQPMTSCLQGNHGTLSCLLSPAHLTS